MSDHQPDPQPEPLRFDAPQYDYPAPPSKRLSKLRVLIALLVLALIVGGSILGVRQYQEHQRVEAHKAAVAKKKAEQKAAAAKREREVKACQDALEDYIDALAEIDAKLDVGMNVTTLTSLAGDASVEKSKVDEDDLPTQTCEDAKDAADDALDGYIQTASDWDDCIWDDYCDPDYDLDLQTTWADSSDSVEAAQGLMNRAGEDT